MRRGKTALYLLAISFGTAALMILWPVRQPVRLQTAVVEDGDEIVIDVPARRMDVLLSDEEIAKRKESFRWVFPGGDHHRFLRMFSRQVGSMAKGGIWDV